MNKKNKQTRVSRQKEQALGWDEGQHPKEGDLVISPMLPGALGTVTCVYDGSRRDAMPGFGGTAWGTTHAEVMWIWTDSTREDIDADGCLELRAEKRHVTYEKSEFEMLVKVGNINPEYTIHVQCGQSNIRNTEEVRDEINDGPRCCEMGSLRHHDADHPTCINAEFAKAADDTHEDQWIQTQDA